MTRLQVADDYGKIPTDNYLKTQCFMDVIIDGRRILNAANRCGITAPGYVERATYKVRDTIYVYEAGGLIPTAEWYARPESVELVPPVPERKARKRKAVKG